MAIINGLGPRKLHMEQHGQIFRILDQNNMVYCEVDDEDIANIIVAGRNNNLPIQKRYVQVTKKVTLVVEVDSTSDVEATHKAVWDVKNLVKRNRAEWKMDDRESSILDTQLVQEDEYEAYRRWRDSWKP